MDPPCDVFEMAEEDSNVEDLPPLDIAVPYVPDGTLKHYTATVIFVHSVEQLSQDGVLGVSEGQKVTPWEVEGSDEVF